ncbi:hypothetical protein M0802_013416 [Mischocyttarus mexicanus]|nr:hypothetical protein M0802_013416 [Mischocyttarus mexicanus]
MIEGASLQKYGKNLEFVLAVPETTIPAYVNYADKSGILYNKDEDLSNVIIQFNGYETLKDYQNYLEEVINFAMRNELNEIAIDVADLQRIFSGQTANTKGLYSESSSDRILSVYSVGRLETEWLVVSGKVGPMGVAARSSTLGGDENST